MPEKENGVKVKVENLTVNDLWSRFFSNLSSFLEKTNLPFIKIKSKHKHNYLRSVMSFHHVLHLAKMCVIANIY